jgi:uncharacterized protein (TIGR02001 family)
MKKLIFLTTAALILSSSMALAADMATKAPAAAAPAVTPNPFDIAFGAAIMTDYNFRGITQSNHKPSVNAYFEPRYNFTPDWQIYGGLGGYSIEFPNNAAAEIDIYGGIRPTFGKLALDFGVWYYYYPGGRTFTGFTGAAPALFDPNPFCTNLFTAFNAACNAIKNDLSFVEIYAKGTYTFNDNFAIGAQFYYDPSWLNSGAPGYYLNGNVKYTGTAFANGVGWYVSGDIAHYWLGTTDAFYAFTNLPDYTTWDVGVGLTYKVFTLDFRYYDTDASKANCNVLTGDHTAVPSAGFITPLNPSGLGSNWCGAAFIVALKADLTASANLK